MYKQHLSNELLKKWQSWYIENLGSEELPVVCKLYGICPPGFRSPEKVPYFVLRSYFHKKVFPTTHADTSVIINQLRTSFPNLETQIDSLPISCTVADVQALDREIYPGDLAIALLLSGRNDLQNLALKIIEEKLPFESQPDNHPSPISDNTVDKENRRLTRLLENLKKSFQKKEEKWRNELSKLRDERNALQRVVQQLGKKHQKQVALFQQKLQDEQVLRQAAQRQVKLMERNYTRSQQQIQKLEFRNLQLSEINESHQTTIQQLKEEVARLRDLLSPASETTTESDLRMHVENPTPLSEPDALNYPPVVQGILHIPIRSKFGFLRAEQEMDLYVSEKIIYSIGAEDGDELEGHLVGEYAPGLPQYRYCVLRKGVEPSNHRELLGIVENRSGWIGVRDLYDQDLFIPLHAYELQNVTVGDVVTLLFDAGHPHNNRILTVHEHFSPDETGTGHPTRRKAGKTDSSKSENSREMEQILQGMHILICGAQSNMVTPYEEAIRSRGGSVLVLENQPRSMQPYVAKADIIICNTHQINHPFYWMVKEESSRQKKPVRYPLSGGVSSIVRELEMHIKNGSAILDNTPM
ncbi:DUF2325 domain-containing protein [Effusibacillus consociatus]|uniref:DUF2325 domain-containing protein n=1 Tax=Effusibacillus consociatus TaxID=1117041 RepID=A0ABV9Q5K3_9BACL